jgi:hypothetical protein
MSALLEFECQPPVGGYEVVAFDERKAKWTALDSLTLTSDATDDERYLAKRWGPSMLGDLAKPRIKYMLRPRSERTRRFDLFERGPSVFIELAQATTMDALKGFTVDDNDRFFEGVKTFADQYGLLENDTFFGSSVTNWWLAIVDMRKALDAWGEAERTGDFRKLVRILEKRRTSNLDFTGGGIEAIVLLRNDPLTASARLCIRPDGLVNALWTQLALAIDGHLSLRSCIECHGWFALEAGRGRSDKEYCSNACRMRAYRQRKGGHG